MPEAYSFKLPDAYPTRDSAVDQPSGVPPLPASEDPLAFETFQKQLSALTVDMPPVQRFCKQTSKETFSALFDDHPGSLYNLKAVLKAILCARVIIIEAQHKKAPQTEESQKNWMSSTEKRLGYMACIIKTLGDTFFLPPLEKERNEFARAFIEDFEIYTYNRGLGFGAPEAISQNLKDLSDIFQVLEKATAQHGKRKCYLAILEEAQILERDPTDYNVYTEEDLEARLEPCSEDLSAVKKINDRAVIIIHNSLNLLNYFHRRGYIGNLDALNQCKTIAEMLKNRIFEENNPIALEIVSKIDRYLVSLHTHERQLKKEGAAWNKEWHRQIKTMTKGSKPVQVIDFDKLEKDKKTHQKAIRDALTALETSQKDQEKLKNQLRQAKQDLKTQNQLMQEVTQLRQALESTKAEQASEQVKQAEKTKAMHEQAEQLKGSNEQLEKSKQDLLAEIEKLKKEKTEWTKEKEYLQNECLKEIKKGQYATELEKVISTKDEKISELQAQLSLDAQAAQSAQVACQEQMDSQMQGWQDTARKLEEAQRIIADLSVSNARLMQGYEGVQFNLSLATERAMEATERTRNAESAYCNLLSSVPPPAPPLTLKPDPIIWVKDPKDVRGGRPMRQRPAPTIPASGPTSGSAPAVLCKPEVIQWGGLRKK